jgi:hypothetical protein
MFYLGLDDLLVERGWLTPFDRAIMRAKSSEERLRRSNLYTTTQSSSASRSSTMSHSWPGGVYYISCPALSIIWRRLRNSRAASSVTDSS